MTKRLIGITSSHSEDAVKIGEILKTQVVIKRHADEIEKFAARVVGFTLEQMKDEKLLKLYLGKEWSYIRNERFVDPKEGVVQRPVTYHITPEQVIKRIQYLGREIHSQFWINAMYAQYNMKPDDTRLLIPWLVIDCTYPNEADNIVEHDGILIRTERHEKKKGVDYLSGNPHITRMFMTNGSQKSLEDIANQILQL